jgi:hypothetical protein
VLDNACCANCVYSMQHENLVPGGMPLLHCHRYPPRLMPNYESEWPRVEDNDHCGEHPEIRKEYRG